MEFSITRGVIENLQHASTDFSDLDKLERASLFRVTEELFKHEEDKWKCLPVVQDLLHTIQELTRQCAGCFETLDEIGIIYLMSDLLRKISESLTDNGFDGKLQPLIESSTETILAVAESEPQAKAQVIRKLLVHIFEIFEHPALLFKPRMEVLKSVNMLLEQCPVSTKETILEDRNVQNRITALVEMVMEVGDYELQVCIIECLMRIFPRKARQKYAAKFFQDETLTKEFLSIRDKVFETDCRLFLNNLNARNEDPTKGWRELDDWRDRKKVYSVSCISAFIGRKQLRKPDDASYDEFWVDFNIGSTRITLFCAQEGKLSQGTQVDEDLWETVEICKSNVKKYSIRNQDVLLLEVNLRNSISQIYPSQHPGEEGDCIRLQFDPQLTDYVSHAVSQTFNFDKQKKSKVSTVEIPLQISIKGQDLYDGNNPEKKEVGSHSNSQDQFSQSSSIGKKKKISVPSVPMQPSSISLARKSPVVEEAANKSNVKKTLESEAPPKTPVKTAKMKVKIKTPVVEICNSVTRKKKNTKDDKKNAKRTKDIGAKHLEDIVISESQTFVDEQISKDGDRKQLDCTSNNKADNISSLEQESKFTSSNTKDKAKSKSEDDPQKDSIDCKELSDSKIDAKKNTILTKQTTEKEKFNKERSAKSDVKYLNYDKDSFGFDDIEEVDTVPESLEFKTTESNKEDTVRNLKTSNNETGVKKTSVDEESEKKTYKSGASVSKGKKINKEKKPTKSKNSSKEIKGPSITYVHESLKKVGDLESMNKPKSTSALNQMVEERRPLSQEEVDEIYTFKDHHENSHIVSMQKSKETVKNTNSKPVGSIKTKAKDRNGTKSAVKKEIACYNEDHAGSNKVDNVLSCGNKNVRSKTSQPCDQNYENKAEKYKKCDTTRTLRKRTTLPYYKDISETETENGSTEGCKSDIYDSSKSESRSAGLSVSNMKEKHKNEFLKNQSDFPSEIVECNKMIHIPIQTGSKVADPLESQIVIFNSDESDIEVHETGEQRQHSSTLNFGGESKNDDLENSLEESLFVETDDSCNARNYKILYKDKKKRSSLKRRENLKSCLMKSNISISSSESIVQQEKDREKRHKKEKGKNVSFDDSVLKGKTFKKQSKTCNKENPTEERKPFSNKNCASNEERYQKIEKQLSKVTKSKKIEHADNNLLQQHSYSKFESKYRHWGMLQTSSRKNCGLGYDPFDFDAQSDNTSNRSERLDRIDISKSLNEKYGRKSIAKSGKTKEETSMNEKYTYDSRINDQAIKPSAEYRAPSLMVQDQVTKRWHRSREYTCNKAVEGGRLIDSIDDSERLDNHQSSSPIGSETGEHLPVNMVENDVTTCNNENYNSFQNILKDIESKRQSNKVDTQDECIGEILEPGDFGNNLHISPIQTPHLSSTSTPKISNGKRKQYTPLNISVIKTPQSLTPCEKIEQAISTEYPDDASTETSSKNSSTKTSSKNSRQSISSDADSIMSSSVRSEKSWIKFAGQRRKKTPVTYKQMKPKTKQTYMLSTESPSSVNYGVERGLVASKCKIRKTEETLPTVKSAILKLKEIGLPGCSNDDDDSVSGMADSVDLNSGLDVRECKLISQENLVEQILTPYTPMKSESSHMPHEFDIDTIQTQEDLTMKLSDEDASSIDLSDYKFRKQTLLGDSGFHSGPSSAVRPSSTSLKRKYPDLKLIDENYDNIVFDDNDDEDDANSNTTTSDEDSENAPLIPRKLFRFDSSVPEMIQTDQDSSHMTDCAGDSTSSGSFNVGFSSYLNSLGSDVRRQMKRKQEQVEMFAKQAVKELQKHHSQNWGVQQQYRSNVYVEFKTKMMLELEALEKDIDLLKDAELKTTEVFKYQLDVLKQNKARQMSSLSNMKGLNYYLREKTCKVAKHNKTLQNDLRDILKKDLTTLQRKLINQTQKQELSNIKRMLQRTFSTSNLW